MKTIGIFVFALASLPTVALADRNWDLRDTEYYKSSGVPDEHCNMADCKRSAVPVGIPIESAPLQLDRGGGNDGWTGLSNFQRQMIRADE